MFLYRHLSTARRRQLLWLGILMPLAALAEMLLLAAIVPFLAALGQGVETKSLLGDLLRWLDRFIPAGDLAAAALLFAAAALLVAALRLALSWTSLRFAAELGHELNMAIQRRMLSQPYLFHVSSHSSRLLASLEKVDRLVLGLALRGIQAMGAAIISAAVIAALLLIDIRSAAVAVALVLVLYGLALLRVRRRFKGYSDFLATAHDRRIQLVQENVGGIRDLIVASQIRHLENPNSQRVHRRNLVAGFKRDQFGRVRCAEIGNIVGNGAALTVRASTQSDNGRKQGNPGESRLGRHKWLEIHGY
jgi:ATP-binding cassette subfamily B protein